MLKVCNFFLLLDKYPVARTTRVCKDWYEPSLDLLWCDVESFHQLLTCLSPLKRSNTTFVSVLYTMIKFIQVEDLFSGVRCYPRLCCGFDPTFFEFNRTFRPFYPNARLRNATGWKAMFPNPILQDVIDAIIGHLVGDLTSLKCCALVSSSCLQVSHKHIFSEVRIYTPHTMRNLFAVLTQNPNI